MLMWKSLIRRAKSLFARSNSLFGAKQESRNTLELLRKLASRTVETIANRRKSLLFSLLAGRGSSPRPIAKPGRPRPAAGRSRRRFTPDCARPETRTVPTPA
jgi:hypothetical protein